MFGKTITHKADAIAVILFLLSLKVSKYKKIGSKVEVPIKKNNQQRIQRIIMGIGIVDFRIL